MHGYSPADVTRPNESRDSELHSVVNAVQRGLRKVRAKELKKKDDLANKVCALLNKNGDAIDYKPTKPGRSSRRASPKSAGSMDTRSPVGSMRTGSSGLRSASKALSVSFDDDHAMETMRERMATRKKKKQMADDATKSLSSKGKALKGTKKSTVDGEGRKLTKCLDRALQDCVGDIEDMEDATQADCTARRPLALKLAKVHQPCALVVKKTELVEGVNDTHGFGPRRKLEDDTADWAVRVPYGLESPNHGRLRRGRRPARAA